MTLTLRSANSWINLSPFGSELEQDHQIKIDVLSVIAKTQSPVLLIQYLKIAMALSWMNESEINESVRESLIKPLLKPPLKLQNVDTYCSLRSLWGDYGRYVDLIGSGLLEERHAQVLPGELYVHSRFFQCYGKSKNLSEISQLVVNAFKKPGRKTSDSLELLLDLVSELLGTNHGKLFLPKIQESMDLFSNQALRTRDLHSLLVLDGGLTSEGGPTYDATLLGKALPLNPATLSSEDQTYLDDILSDIIADSKKSSEFYQSFTQAKAHNYKTFWRLHSNRGN